MSDKKDSLMLTYILGIHEPKLWGSSHMTWRLGANVGDASSIMNEVVRLASRPNAASYPLYISANTTRNVGSTNTCPHQEGH